MPNFDGGHYFLTVLVPIKNDPFVDDEGRHRSRPDTLREILGNLPTAHQREGGHQVAAESPFMRNKQTHLARFVVINDVIFNGRVPSDAVLSKLSEGGNPIIPGPVDRLNRPYLLFAADIDTETGDNSALDGYLAGLWKDMGKELRAIFEHCERFTDDVKDAKDFCAYIRKCQLETTMPFNDYWAEGLPAKNPPLKKILLAVLAAFGAAALWLGFGQWGLWGWILAAIVVVALTAVFAYGFVTVKGGKRLPTAPDSDLRSILKALYLQQNFVNFAIKNQGASDEDLHANFGKFLKEHKPQDLDSPTQDPGVIRSQI
ncbi:MAG: hypothetical protein QNJ67_07790 [Kiloniellales bacterium]|nr:hypothetical protein [Kiloniellales bacterium]